MHDLPLIAPRRDTMRKLGHWRDETVTDFLDRFVAACPDKTALIAYSSERGNAARLTYAQLNEKVTRAALGLARLGVGKGDVVAMQLPNWWEYVVLHLAAVRLGAVTNPLMIIFRQHELRFMLRFSQAKVMVIPKSFRGFDFPAMLDELRPELPDLAQVVVVGEDGPDGWDSTLGGTAPVDQDAAARLFAANKPSGDDLIQLLYTSGTTGEPKGVMHTSNTIFSNLHPFADRLGLGAGDVIHMPSPMAHQLGFMYGLILPVMLGATAVLQDIFEVTEMARQLTEERASFTMAATPFLNDLTEYAIAKSLATPDLRIFVSAGAPIPRALVTRASETLGSAIVSAWGMSENGAVTTTSPSDPVDKITNTDGHCLPGMEVRVVDETDQPVPAGTAGRLQVRGCSNFAGYLRRPELNTVDPDGWFETGDIARMDEDGYIRIAGRSKDIIIRGGENIPVVEIENLLFKHPSIAVVAIVGVSDPRLGERACAVVVLKQGASLSFEDMSAFLLEQQVAKQYIPEQLRIVDDLPRTPTGKIQKFRLREWLN
ncbi:MAG: cyclohexanecarboxylate-CoA ligase [Magnetospirillum sp.]